MATKNRINTLSGNDVLDHATLMRYVSLESGVPVETVHRVLESLWASVRKNLILGYKVKVNGLGTFHRMQRYSQTFDRSKAGTGCVKTVVSLSSEMRQDRVERIE